MTQSQHSTLALIQTKNSSSSGVSPSSLASGRAPPKLVTLHANALYLNPIWAISLHPRDLPPEIHALPLASADLPSSSALPQFGTTLKRPHSSGPPHESQRPLHECIHFSFSLCPMVRLHSLKGASPQISPRVNLLPATIYSRMCF